MPNWIMNEIVSKDIDKMRELLLNDNEEVTFEKLLPMPKDLMITSGSCSYGRTGLNFNPEAQRLQMIIDTKLYETYNKRITRETFLSKVLEDESVVNSICELLDVKKTDKEHLECYVSGFFNLKRYGSTDWYNWHIEHWGTKWDASDGYIESNSIHFDTAWSTPMGILKELAKHCDFIILYTDEDRYGDNSGVLQFVNGEMTDLSADAGITPRGIAFAFRNEDPMEDLEKPEKDDYDSYKDYKEALEEYKNNVALAKEVQAEMKEAEKFLNNLGL